MDNYYEIGSEVDKLKQNIKYLRAEIRRLTIENAKLVLALQDAINRPMGVVPESAEKYYYPKFNRENYVKNLKAIEEFNIKNIRE